MTTRLMAVLAAVVLSACSSQTPTAIKPSPTPSRPAPAMVQVENDPQSHPQYGLQKADMVYEYLTEGGITRFTLIYFNPQGGDRIEPVRSARLITLRLQKVYQGVVFFSGASSHVQGLMNDQHVPAVDENATNVFSRDNSRRAPHNLMTTQDQLKQAIEQKGLRVTYELPKGAQPTAKGDAGTKISFQQTNSHNVTYAYSQNDQAYAYSYEGGALTDAGNGNKQVLVTNVVLLRVAHHGAGYTEDVVGSEGIDFDLEGSGPAEVYTRGQHFAAKWDVSAGPLRVLDATGKPLTMPDGLTWFHVVDPDMQVQAS